MSGYPAQATASIYSKGVPAFLGIWKAGNLAQKQACWMIENQYMPKENVLWVSEILST